MAGTVREALENAGIPLPDRSVERELRDEIKRLTKIVQEQSGEKRRLGAAFAKLKDEKRSTHEMIGIAEQLQDEIEALEDSVNFYESDRITQSLRDAQRSKQALSIRYGVLHNVLRTLLADPSARKQAEDALGQVTDARWVRSQIEETEG